LTLFRFFYKHAVFFSLKCSGVAYIQESEDRDVGVVMELQMKRYLLL